MRAKAIFSVFGRKLKSGRMVFYYHCYNGKGKRQWAKSTGLSKKTEAVAYCMNLYKEGLLIPELKTPTFAEFSNGWWDIQTCGYLKWRQLHDPMGTATVRSHYYNFNGHIKDYLAKYRLDEITPNVIENWLILLSEKKQQTKDGGEKNWLKLKTINLILSTLRLMMKEAVRLKLLKTNPCAEVKDVKEDDVKREILTVEEVRKLFPADCTRRVRSTLRRIPYQNNNL